MLGWMIKRGLDGGRDAPEDEARAFKSALFGTPARRDETEVDVQPAPAPVPTTQESLPKASAATGAVQTKKNTSTKDTGATPGRLPGILLTPGTATSRRKRVSFGHEVSGEGVDKKNELRIDKNGRKPNLFGDSTRSKTPRTTLGTSLQNDRKQNNKPAAPSKLAVVDNVASTNNRAVVDEIEDDNLWEEVDDDDRDPDITVDLNEPHSQSGRYWKSEFQRYQEDAKVEMGKLLKYKQLAKSYAKMKDAEAADMRTKLQEEKEKVTEMEGRITELADQIARKRMHGSDHEYQELISDLTRQTARAVQYRNQVKELEAMLQDNEKPATATTTVASPRTQRTLIDTQRELRRAREQAKELTQAKEEIRRLRSKLGIAEQRAGRKNENKNESKTLANDLAASEAAAEALAAKVEDLEKRAQFAEDEKRQKVKELSLLQRKYDSLKDDAKARVGEAEQVMRRKNEEIADLKKQVRKATAAAVRQPALEPPVQIDALKDIKDIKDTKDTNNIKDTKAGKNIKTMDSPVSDSAAAKLALLRRRRGAEPLRPVVDAPQPTAILESIGTNRVRGAEKEKPKAEPLPERSAKGAPAKPYRPTITTSAPAPPPAAERDDPVAAAAAAAADASCLSISSERAAAAVARIEKRRAQRKLELEALRNKENMQPA
ncbi:hypothetical protein SPBR_00319 [Sporothrix brasiliensis 5110]|uniref:Spindle pole body-associated protein cut12 domain-containing protein n=1 Tax=Sporothrix brasiliensis 5110 TaxID=1398154 RepID=A0A0C2EU41_9PEZI|nr:uncharacterized protein SPBR_00319 [Sporothrix brasiliensis 5110]KIH90059.1 hypothetical protein SPBR_00319 [Sporothrix brasiliensis 5110]